MADTTYTYVSLYEDSSCFENTYHSARIYEDSICVDEETSKHAPGNRYGLRYEVKGPDFEVFKCALGAEGEELAKAVLREFSGKYGVSRFIEFCK